MANSQFFSLNPQVCGLALVRKFSPENCLRFFGVLQPTPKATPKPVRHTFGGSVYRRLRPKKPVIFHDFTAANLPLCEVPTIGRSLLQVLLGQPFFYNFHSVIDRVSARLYRVDGLHCQIHNLSVMTYQRPERDKKPTKRDTSGVRVNRQDQADPGTQDFR